MRDDFLHRLLRALEEGRPVVTATLLPEGSQALILPLEPDAGEGAPGWDPVEGGSLLDEARKALLEDRSASITSEVGTVFLRPYNPPVRLVVVGAVHITAPLAQMAGAAGIEVHVVDPRTAFATAERFPGVHVLDRWPAEALEELQPDHRTAVVTLTHDAKLDDPALRAALASPAFYVGALGSTRTHAKRVKRLREDGVSEEDIGRIRAPVGVDIGARTPAEIAVAILAELVAHLRRAEAS
ncbi:MAG: XdhC family protein [Gemmatimonadales bacterium]|nr:MAG: XdhC family protein [Gemmatimonadales bacterium]